MTRRRLLAALGAVAGAGVGIARWGGWRSLPTPVHLRLAGLVGDRRSARVVGEAYLLRTPDESGPQQLASLILDGRTTQRWTDEDLRRLTLAGVRRDFERERTVVLDGWVLSRTEARLCALTALHDGPH